LKRLSSGRPIEPALEWLAAKRYKNILLGVPTEEWRLTAIPLLCYSGDHETRLAMTSKSWIALLMAFVLTVVQSVSPAHAVEDARKVSVVSFGLFGDQGVFKSEATGAAQVVATRFGNGPINVQHNSKRGGGATIEALAKSLQAAAKGMAAENDVLFLILTSHGSPAGLAVKAKRLTQTLTPSNLADMLARTGVRHKVVVISACYSGVFIPRLANPDMLVITAADADHPSFGCRDKAKWTYFGNAFFNVALRQAKSIKAAFVVARGLVQKRELREHFEPSNPQMAGGANVPLLIATLNDRPASPPTPMCAETSPVLIRWRNRPVNGSTKRTS
jgi:Peptidase C13 family